MHDYKRLKVWQRAQALAQAVYRESRTFTHSDSQVLRRQLCRAALGIPSSIAEGAGRSSQREFARFLDIAAASANEVESQLTLARDLECLKRSVANQLIQETTEVRRMLAALIRHARNEKEEEPASPSPPNDSDY